MIDHSKEQLSHTLLDNAVTNNLPNPVLFVTPNFNPGSISGTYDPHPVGVCYNSGSGRWAILNEDGGQHAALCRLQRPRLRKLTQISSMAQRAEPVGLALCTR